MEEEDDLYEVCKRAMAKLNIHWPAAQDTEGVILLSAYQAEILEEMGQQLVW